MAYKRAIVKSMKAKEFTKSVADQTRLSSKKDDPSTSSGSGSGGPPIRDDAPYSPGSGYPGDESQESTPYSPGGDVGFTLGGEDKDSLQGKCRYSTQYWA